MWSLTSSKLIQAYSKGLSQAFELLALDKDSPIMELALEMHSDVGEFLGQHQNERDLAKGFLDMLPGHLGKYTTQLVWYSAQGLCDKEKIPLWEAKVALVYRTLGIELAKRKTILVLTAHAGDGHRSAAKGVVQGMHTYHPLDVRVIEREIPVDLLTMYEPAVTHTPAFYKWIFETTDTSEVAGIIHEVSHSVFANRLQEIVDEEHPDMIVATVSLYGLGHWIERVLRKTYPDLRFYVVVTDSISIHRAWIAPGVDGYIVTNDETKRVMIEKGVPEERVHALGFPLPPQFYAPHDREVLRMQEGIASQDLVFLCIFNTGVSIGDMAFLQTLQEKALSGVQFLLVLGKNTKIYGKLKKMNLTPNVRLYGWVSDMDRMMAIADLVVTKAGGASVMECVAMHKPMIISKILPGQEEGNAVLVKKYHIGTVMKKGDRLEDVMMRYVEDPSLITRQKNGFLDMNIPDATKQIAHFLFKAL